MGHPQEWRPTLPSVGVFCIIVASPDRQKMEALLSAMSSLSQGSTFPCMPFVAYAIMKKMHFVRHLPEQGEVILEHQKWVVPDFTGHDFYQVPKDFLTASFVFLGSIPECKVAVQSLRSVQSAPSTMVLQQRMAPDQHTKFLQDFGQWLSAGRSSTPTANLQKWNRMAHCMPFWMDPQICQQKMTWRTEGSNMVQQQQNKET